MHIATIADAIISPANQPLFVCIFAGLFIIALGIVVSHYAGDKEEAGPDEIPISGVDDLLS